MNEEETQEMIRKEIVASRDDLRMMENPELWPRWPFLPIKKRADNSWDCALLHASAPNAPVVYFVNLLELSKYAVEGLIALDKVPQEKFDSIAAITAAGWVVD